MKHREFHICHLDGLAAFKFLKSFFIFHLTEIVSLIIFLILIVSPCFLSLRSHVYAKSVLVSHLES